MIGKHLGGHCGITHIDQGAIDYAIEIGRAHVRTPVTEKSRMPSSA